MTTKKVRCRGNWLITEDGNQLISLPTDTGGIVFTQSQQESMKLNAGTYYNAWLGVATGGIETAHHVWVKASTGVLLVNWHSQATTNTNSVSLLAGGQLMIINTTLGYLKFKNKNSTTSISVDYWIAGS